MPVSNENEILFHPKQILMAVSPNLSQCESWSPPCEAVFRHFVMKKVNRSDSISTFMYVGGLINRFHPVSCPRSDSTRPLLFSHPLSGGHRSRPSLLGRQGYLLLHLHHCHHHHTRHPNPLLLHLPLVVITRITATATSQFPQPTCS